MNHSEARALASAPRKRMMRRLASRRLSEEETRELVVKAQSGDREAMRRLVEGHLLLACKVAWEFSRDAHRIEECIQEGAIGIMKAVERFDLSREHDGAHVRFSTYACYWIKHHVRTAILASRACGPHVPIHVLEALHVARGLALGEGMEPRKAVKIAAERSGQSEEIIVMGYDATRPTAFVRLDATAPPQGGGSYGVLEWADVIADERYDLAEDLATADAVRRIRRLCDEFMSRLRTTRERDVFLWRIWQRDGERTLENIGDEHGLSKERVRQVENVIRKKFDAFVRRRLRKDLAA